MTKQIAVFTLLLAACSATPADDAAAESEGEMHVVDVAELIRSQQEALAADSADFARRRASMSTPESCMEQAQALEPPQRARIEAACRRLEAR